LVHNAEKIEKIVVFKEPEYENDSSYFRINTQYVEKIRDTIRLDEYYTVKDRMFREKDVDNSNLIRFRDEKPSLRNMPRFLEGTVYTFTCEKKNGKSYENIVETVKSMLSEGSRRALVTISDRLLDYEMSTKDSSVDVSCLSTIHYKKDSVSLFFRASDVENELTTDIVTIYDYFVLPVYEGRSIEIDIFTSSCQNVESFIKFLDILR
jgi:hypothetical protein